MKEIVACAVLASIMATGFIYALDRDTIVQQNKMEAYWQSLE